MVVNQCQLVDKDCPQRQTRGVAKALGGYCLVALEEGIEVLVEVLLARRLQKFFSLGELACLFEGLTQEQASLFAFLLGTGLL